MLFDKIIVTTTIIVSHKFSTKERAEILYMIKKQDSGSVSVLKLLKKGFFYPHTHTYWGGGAGFR